MSWLSYIALGVVMDCLPMSARVRLAVASRDARAVVASHGMDEVARPVQDIAAWAMLFPRGTSLKICSTSMGLHALPASLQHLLVDGASDMTDDVLTRLPNLRSLMLAGCTRVRGEAFARMPHLRQLTLYTCTALTRDAMHGLPISRLDIAYFHALDDAVLVRMPNLTHLTVGYCNYISEHALDNLTGLRSLKIMNCPNVFALPRLRSLHVLDLTATFMRDSHLFNHPALRTLHIERCSGVTGASFSHLTQLECVTVLDSVDVQFSALSHLPATARILYKSHDIQYVR